MHEMGFLLGGDPTLPFWALARESHGTLVPMDEAILALASCVCSSRQQYNRMMA
jgi:hypothetical protein